MGLSFWHILVLAVVVLFLFGGRGRFSDVMGDFAKGIKNFKKGLTEEETPPPPPPYQQPVPPAQQVLPPEPVAHPAENHSQTDKAPR